ncbi:MAG: hypothetical protein B7Z38_02760 [Rhodobacterales bacterium 12-64-8]|nr:MAG: hypothetical protein B7Z38_02760 [Rhodobacterales bacterium 12-64-8]OYX50493.1 MAG: hypothetical protein B7Y90_04025 [Alphaproteobacteria bacterium 32-64-14]
MAWLKAVFIYGHPDSILVPVVMWSTFVLSTAFALLFRKVAWEAAGFWAAFSVFVFVSVVLTVFNGVRSTAPIGGMFMIAYVSIVAFPTAGIVRLLMRLVRSILASRTNTT